MRQVAAVLLVSATLCASASASDWKSKVPDADRNRKNPLASDQSGVAAGKTLYTDKCAKCHGPNGEGKGHHPSLRTAEVHDAAPGELQWLLEHGNRWHGMPSYGSLSQDQRWQLVSFIQSLPVDSK